MRTTRVLTALICVSVHAAAGDLGADIQRVAVVAQRIVVRGTDSPMLRSYLGPPESYRH